MPINCTGRCLLNELLAILFLSIETNICFKIEMTSIFIDPEIDPKTFAPSNGEQFDFLIIMPLMPPWPHDYDYIISNLELSVKYLSNDGLAITILPYSFLKGDRAKKLIKTLEDNDVTLSSVLFLPQGAVENTLRRTTMLVLEKHKPEPSKEVFMSTLKTLKPKEISWVVDRFYEFKQGKTLEESVKYWGLKYETIKTTIETGKGIPSWNPFILIDRPVTSSNMDLFGYAERVKYIGKTLIKVRPPVIGIVGEWGSGKTSIMNMLREYLEDNSEIREGMSVVPIWINLWEFTQIGFSTQEIIYRILEEIRGIIRDGEIKKGIENILKSAAIFAPLLRGIGLGNIAETIDRIEQAISNMNNLPKLLDRISEFLQQNNMYIVIFLDDLDRLTPEEARKAIDAIRVLSSRRDITVVVGYDHQALLKLLSVSMPHVDIEKFLEKVIPVKYTVPKLSPEEYTEIILNLLESSGFIFNIMYKIDLREGLILTGKVLQFNLRRLKVMMTYIFQAIDNLMDKIEERKDGRVRQIERNEKQILYAIVYLSALQASYPDLFFQLVSAKGQQNLNDVILELFDNMSLMNNNDLKKLLSNLLTIDKKSLKIAIELMTAS